MPQTISIFGSAVVTKYSIWKSFVVKSAIFCFKLENDSDKRANYAFERQENYFKEFF